MFLLIISVYFLCIIVVERIQVELCKVFFFLSLSLANKAPGTTTDDSDHSLHFHLLLSLPISPSQIQFYE